jgi:hypothetical protein
MDRRSMLKTSGTLAGLAALNQSVSGEEKAAKQQDGIAFDNAEFYDAEGNFLEDKAKDAVVRLCQYHGYPVFPALPTTLGHRLRHRQIRRDGIGRLCVREQ